MYWKKQIHPRTLPVPFIWLSIPTQASFSKDVEEDLIQEYGPLVGIMEGTSTVLTLLMLA